MKRKGRIKEYGGVIMAAETAAAFAAGFVFSGADVGGAAAFSDISAAGALGVSGSAAIFLGSLFYSFISGGVGRNIVKLSAMLLILIAKLLTDNRSEPKICGIITSAGVFLSGTAVSLIIGEFAAKLLFYLFYSTLAGITAYSAADILTGLRRKHMIDLTESGCCYAVVYTVFTATLCSFSLSVFNIGIIFGEAVTLLAAFNYGHIGGVLCGALTVCGAFLASAGTGMTVVLLPGAALLTGYLYRRRSWSAALFFAAAGIMLMILTGMTDNAESALLNTVLGSAAFMLADRKFTDKLVKTASLSEMSAHETAETRLIFMSDTIRSIRDDADRIAEMLKQRENDDKHSENRLEKVCTDCYRKNICRRKGSSVIEGLEKLSVMTEVSMESFPSELDTCIRRNELISAHESLMQDDLITRLLETGFSSRHELVMEQMRTIEDILRFAGEFPDMRKSEPVSRLIEMKLGKFGYEPTFTSACYNSSNRLYAEIYFDTESAPVSSTRICDLISDEMRMELNCTEPLSSGTETRITLFEKPRYRLDVYTASSSADDSGENGDTSISFSEGTGLGCVVLSDGMGSGRSAAFESRLVVKLFRRLISSGMRCDAAVRLINEVMLTKSKEESFATLDALLIDLDKGGMTVIKSGAAATVIRRGRDVIRISAVTFPVGINEKSELFTAEQDFGTGDIAIMFSDGINENEYLFIRELLLGGDDLKRIVDEICSKADRFSPNVRNDDITVIGVRIVEN